MYGNGQADPFRYISINDGSPDQGGVEIFHVLMGKDTPTGMIARFWENIGSQIRFDLGGDTAPVITTQAYPTYHIFHNGQLTETRQQAPTPEENFYHFPYPFGGDWCQHGPHGITPQGRCGNAESPREPDSRIPAYTVP